MSAMVRQGVILAAGRGTRLQPLSFSLPKPLHPICNKPIMQYQIEAMRDSGIVDIAIVIGALGDTFREQFGDGRDLGVRITYLEDPVPAGIASSLLRAEPWVDGPFMVFLGDIFLALDDLTPAIAPLHEGAAGTLAVRQDEPDAVRRNFAVLTGRDGKVTRVIEKPANPPTNLKGCGVYTFDQTIFEAIRRTPRSALRNEYEITDAVQTLIEMGRPVYAAEVVRWDVNITFPADLLNCNLRVLDELAVDSLVGKGAVFRAEARLSGTIVGQGATIDAPVLLEQCLVLPGATVADLPHTVRRHIFGRETFWADTLGRPLPAPAP
jgi:dTDP-glucose pyrophosphorylase